MILDMLEKVPRELTIVLASDDIEYIIKGPSKCPSNPFVGANELIAANLARLLKLPLLRHVIVQWEQHLFFGSERLSRGDMGIVTAELLAKCQNRDCVYDLIAFDSRLINEDRHIKNLIVRTQRRRRQESAYHLTFNDHSHALLPPMRKPFHLDLWVAKPANAFVLVDYIRDLIVDIDSLSSAVARIENLADDSIRTCIDLVPEEWLSVDDRNLVIDFLFNRREYLRKSFDGPNPRFPALMGGSL